MKPLTLWVIFSIMILAMAFYINLTIYEKESIVIKTNQPTIVEIPRHIDYWEDKLVLENKLQEIYNIAYLNAQSHEYKLHQYDCTQFSKSLVKKLNNLGYKAQCSAGNYLGSEYTNHTWVSVWINDTRYEIESTNGEFIPDYYFEEGYYTKWREDYCW